MANGHVEIHDPFANNNVASSNADPTSQTTDMDDTVEFKLLMVYSQRRRLPRREGGELGSPGQTDTPSTQATENDKEVTEEEKKKKKKKKRRGTKGMLKMFSCIKPSVKKDEPSEPDSPASEAVFRCAVVEPGEFFFSGCVVWKNSARCWSFSFRSFRRHRWVERSGGQIDGNRQRDPVHPPTNRRGHPR